MKKSRRLWDKGGALDSRVAAYTVGDDYLLDAKLVPYDCIASIAHARMLARAGFLKKREAEKLASALREIMALSREGRFSITPEDEDAHTAIENYLTEKLGDLGKKIHTARSRNDQVLTALRLYYKDQLSACEASVDAFMRAVRGFLKKYGKIPLPGYTHTRKAMPSSVSLWGNAFLDSMRDNLKLVDAVRALVDQSPLGTGAGYGVPLKIDRAFTARALGFKRVQESPIYAQHSRGKFESTLLHALGQITFDLNRMACDLILFSLPEFGYFEIPARFSTGSSIMPQKKNPDVLELIRGNHHAVVACEFQIKNTTANLISGYHRDQQLTKQAVMRGSEIAIASLGVMTLVLKELQVNEAACRKAMTAELFAAEEAYALVKKGVPFRDAYRMIGERFR